MPVGILAHPIPEWWLSRSRISNDFLFTFVCSSCATVCSIDNFSNLVGYFLYICTKFISPSEKSAQKNSGAQTHLSFLSLHRIHFHISIIASIFRSSLPSKLHHQEYNKKSARMTVHFLYTENSDRSCHSDQTHLHR